MLNKKFLTKLLNEDFRNKILINNSRILLDKTLSIDDYAHYVVDYQILNRSKEYQDNKDAYYGFTPIAPICYVSLDDTVKVNFFEMNSVNHFLRIKDGNTAVDVVKCILIQIYLENKFRICNFDINKIDATLKDIERKYVNEQSKTQDNQTKEIK